MFHIAQNMLLSGSIGIIGGADGPTTIFVTAGEGWQIVPVIAAAAVVAAVALLIRRRRKK